MNNFFTRLLTSVISGVVFFGLYHMLPSFFVCLLVSLAAYMVCVEWPRISTYSTVVSYWYPLIPLALLVTHVYVWQVGEPWYGLYPFLAAWIVDAAGYLVGTRWGVHKCWPTISPHKTWEGVAAGVVALMSVQALWCLFADGSISFWFGIGVAPLVAIGAIIGDFFVSWHKRRSGVKDVGHLLPGHGGLLDRFDSVLGVIVVVKIVECIWYVC